MYDSTLEKPDLNALHLLCSASRVVRAERACPTLARACQAQGPREGFFWVSKYESTGRAESGVGSGARCANLLS